MLSSTREAEGKRTCTAASQEVSAPVKGQSAREREQVSQRGTLSRMNQVGTGVSAEANLTSTSSEIV